MMTLVNPKNGETFNSPHASDRGAAEALSELVAAGKATSEFAVSLLSKAKLVLRGRAKYPLTEAQRFWLHKLTEPRRQQEATAEFDMTPLREMFEQAGEHLKRPSIVLGISGGREVKISVAGSRSRYAGQLMVADPEFGGPYYGRVDVDGKFYAGRDRSSEVLDLLEALQERPEEVAAEHGHLTGNCCFCRRELSDERSTSVGYGPVCVKRFNLRW